MTGDPRHCPAPKATVYDRCAVRPRLHIRMISQCAVRHKAGRIKALFEPACRPGIATDHMKAPIGFVISYHIYRTHSSELGAPRGGSRDTHDSYRIWGVPFDPPLENSSSLKIDLHGPIFGAKPSTFSG